MKKIKLISAVCAMALAASFTLTGCGSDDAGRYNLKSMTEDGQEMSFDDIKSMYEEMGMDVPEMYIELKDDGTGKVVLGDGNTENIEWEDGVITADGEEVKYTIDGKELSMERDGSELVYEKE